MSAAATARPQAAAHGGEIDILRSFARRIDPSDAGAYNNLGVLYFRKGLTDEAIAAFTRALALDERMGVARRNLEIAYGDSGIGSMPSCFGRTGVSPYALEDAAKITRRTPCRRATSSTVTVHGSEPERRAVKRTGSPTEPVARGEKIFGPPSGRTSAAIEPSVP